MTIERKKISFSTDIDISLYDVLDGKDIDQVYEALQEVESKARAKYPNAIRFYIDVYSGYGELDISFLGERSETDAEYKKRTEREQKVKTKNEKQKKEKEDRERALYAELKKKYGNE